MCVVKMKEIPLQPFQRILKSLALASSNSGSRIRSLLGLYIWDLREKYQELGTSRTELLIAEWICVPSLLGVLQTCKHKKETHIVVFGFLATLPALSSREDSNCVTSNFTLFKRSRSLVGHDGSGSLSSLNSDWGRNMENSRLTWGDIPLRSQPGRAGKHGS